MRCMASTARGVRCRREGAKTGDMRRYCVQHGRAMRRRENTDEVTILLAKFGYRGPYRVGIWATWSNFDLDSRIALVDHFLDVWTTEEALRRARFKLDAVTAKIDRLKESADAGS